MTSEAAHKRKRDEGKEDSNKKPRTTSTGSSSSSSFVAGPDYSRGPSGKGLSDKYTTACQVDARLKKLAKMKKTAIASKLRAETDCKKRLGAIAAEEARLALLRERLQ